MEVKPRETPDQMLHTEALDRRLDENHKSKRKVHKKAKTLRKGFQGEESLHFILGFLEEDKYHILHNLRLKDVFGFFQIDTLILSAQLNLITEVKNFFGTITYDGMGQTIRTANDKEEGFKNHVEQVRMQHLRLLRWLRQFDLPPIPLEKLVVYSDPGTIIKNITNDPAITNTVIHKENLLTKINQFNAIHQSKILSDEQLRKLSYELIAAHTPEDVDVMKLYEVSKDDIKPGVICPSCNAMPMSRIYGKWKCEQCGTESKDAHIAALKDYCILIGNTINNREAREFLMLDSIYITKKLLQKEQFTQIGSTSGRKYILEFQN
ncbi:nuclease-related domain-containing protein [Virgibacillus byunsanensis]|uniref:Nuclease-related domain-containing protein n=1 Tax=Virgibacillus byunsanensis TaxID=570945 RepID=A0ABW3LR87_9BACI